MMHPESSLEHNGYENLLMPLTIISALAQIWLDERPTLRYQVQPVYHDQTVREVDYKYHFGIAYEYLSMAQEETNELCRAFTKKNIQEELGDVLLLLTHFGNTVGIKLDDINRHLETNTPKYLLKTNRRSIRDATASLSNSVRQENHLLFGGPMSFEEGPWLAHRDSREWQEYKKTLVDRWVPAYLLSGMYAMKKHLSITGIVSETISKISYNFPAPFFQPTTTPFHYHKYNYNARSFCRLIRSAGYLDEYHSLFSNGVSKQELGQWTFDILQKIRAISKNKKHIEKASSLLSEYSFNRDSLYSTIK